MVLWVKPARLGAQVMLQKGLEAEVDSFLGRRHFERSGDGAKRGYRNGQEPKSVNSRASPLLLDAACRGTVAQATPPAPGASAERAAHDKKKGTARCPQLFSDARWVLLRAHVGRAGQVS